ncbi:SMI1/KNR4 family protein [Streptococcus mutans]|uniref:SMI1/KNR4 family protein n=1 Tax=Streptococcus mutans TaxID=1309 RepID=UPI0028F06E18|nr:SMI1/KNR4 family protein [Streptococcus mutans]MDT9490633.1 SMI1/KNR4 family protein [Streptococcus mutans]
MTVLSDKINSIPNLYKTQPASEEQIINAESRLGLQFSDDFKEYLKKFGSISFYGTEWMGLNTDEFCDVILTTLEARQLYDNFPNDKFIVEDLHIDDIIIISDSEGNTYQWQGGTVEKVYNSLLGYLEACIEKKS